MKCRTQSSLLTLATVLGVAVSLTGCQSPLEHLSAGPHGVACCDAGGYGGIGGYGEASHPSGGQGGFSGVGQAGKRVPPEQKFPASPLPPGFGSRRGSSGRSLFDFGTHDSMHPVAALFFGGASRKERSDSERGVFSCGERAADPFDIRSQNYSPTDPSPDLPRSARDDSAYQMFAVSKPAESGRAESGRAARKRQGGADGFARVSPETAGRASPLRSTSTASARTGNRSAARVRQAGGEKQVAGAISFSPADQRIPLSKEGWPVPEPADTWMEGHAYQEYPDEYIIDGGDRGHPVHYQGPYREGLETEDTVSEYVDHTGKFHVKASNRVAVYAPRFASVRAITTPTGDVSVERLAGLHESTRDSGVSSRVGPQPYTDTAQLRGVRVRSRASGVNSREQQSGTSAVARVSSHTKLLNTYEEFSYFLRGEIKQADEARLAASIRAAVSWSQEQNPVIMAQLGSAHEVKATFRVAEMVGIEDPRTEPGRLEIVKLANRSTAKPGDIITFAIRYSNKGERELTNVRIVDNLTPRLEYIDDSATSDRPGDINLQDNEEGSQVLTFILDDPLEEKTGGLITFQCRVR